MQEARKLFKTVLDPDDLVGVERVLSADQSRAKNIFEEPRVLGPWLNTAAEKNSLDIVKALIAHGADPNLKHKRSGANALDAAAGAGRLDVVQVLREAGAQFDLSSSLSNPVFSAILASSLPVVQYLLDFGIDARVDYQMTENVRYDAVCFALECGEREIASLIALHVASGDRPAAQAHLDRAWDTVKRANRNANPDNIPDAPVLIDV